MKRALACLLLCPTNFSAAVRAAETGHWGYTGHEGPEHWGELSPANEACALGKFRSPVNLRGFGKAVHPELKVAYAPGGHQVVNNGYTIQVNYAEGSIINVGGRVYELKQFHFHSPSENTIEGHAYLMEAHFVHADAEGNLAVVAVLYRAGKHNAELEKACKHMPGSVGESHALPAHGGRKRPPAPVQNLRPLRRLAEDTTVHRSVQWFVMAHAETASPAQFDQFTHTRHHPNNRPVQPLNSRLLTR